MANKNQLLFSIINYTFVKCKLVARKCHNYHLDDFSTLNFGAKMISLSMMKERYPRRKRYNKAVGELSKHIVVFDLFPEYPYGNI